MCKLLLQDWLFHLGDAPEAWQKGYNDGGWQAVSVPHDWSVGFSFSREHSSGTGFLPGGTGWYRAHFALDARQQGKRAFVAFDGVYKNSQVWCNGYYLGLRPNGYVPFEYDITPFLRTDGSDNVISVKVVHEDIADSRWFTGSGIFRTVTLRFCEPVHLVPETLFFSSDLRGDGAAEITLTGEIQNDSPAQAAVGVCATLSGNGGETALCCGQISCAPGMRAAFTAKGVVDKPALWSPDQPNLYTLAASLQGDSADAAESVQVGIRTARFDPDQGFFLNGASMKIKGVCVHHDAGCLGAAAWPQVWQRRLVKLKAMGCNAIRMAHNPHMAELYALCDSMGFLVMDEAFDEWEGVKNKWWQGHNVYPPKHQGYYEQFPTWHEADLRAMVLRGRNHPSIILWSVGNEIDYPNDPYGHPSFEEMTGNNDSNKPESERRYNPDKPDMRRIATVARTLADIVRTCDATRPVLTASAFPELSSHLGFFDPFDVVGYNYKEQYYAQDHARFPALPLLGSENNHDLQAWKAVTDNAFISGQFLWTGIDFLGETVGWPCHGSQAGLLTTAGFEKPAYYRRMSLWSDVPMARLFTAIDGQPLAPSYDYAPGQRLQVVCYTNLPRAELFQNGQSLGEKARGAQDDSIVWEVEFARGTLRATATGEAAQAEDTLQSTLSPASLGVFVWPQPDCAENPRSAYTLRQVEISVLDAEGALSPAAEPMLHLRVEGPGRLLGIDNGNQYDNSEYALPCRRTWQGKAIAYVLLRKECAGMVTLGIDAQGYDTGTVRL